MSKIAKKSDFQRAAASLLRRDTQRAAHGGKKSGHSLISKDERPRLRDPLAQDAERAVRVQTGRAPLEDVMDVAMSTLMGTLARVNQKSGPGATRVSKKEVRAMGKINPSVLPIALQAYEMARNPLPKLKYLEAPELVFDEYVGSDSFALVFLPDGHTFIVGSVDGVLAFDSESGQETGFELHHEPFSSPSSLAIDPSGTWLVTGTEDGEVWLDNLKVPTQNSVALADSGRGVPACAFSPDGKEIATTDGKKIRRWNLVTLEEKSPLLNGHTKDIQSLVYSPDGQTLVSKDRDPKVVLWNLQTGAATHSSDQGHNSGISSLENGPDGLRLLATSYRAVGYWHSDTLESAEEHFWKNINGYPHARRSPDGQRLATTDGNEVKVWDGNDGREIARITLGEYDDVTEVQFSPDGTNLAVLGIYGTLKVYRLAVATP